MNNWLRPLWLMFSRPLRGMGEARDHAQLAPAALIAVLAQVPYLLITQWSYLRGNFALSAAFVFLSALLQAAGMIFVLALGFAPIATLIANLFERRGSFGVVIRQEYSSFAACTFYAWATANLLMLPPVLLVRASGLQKAIGARLLAAVENQPQRLRVDPQILNSDVLLQSLFLLLLLALFFVWATFAVRQVFRLPAPASAAAALGGVVATVIAMRALPLFGGLLGSPFLLILLFFILRGYFSELSRTQKARASFRQNLEAATLNPADASAHYNLGLIHSQRGELTQARERFERAVQIDAEEIDAYYQLGRIARTENRLADAIKNFEQVIAADQTHAQHEIWREVGATYVAAGQNADALEALERFLEHRTSDPEGLYLMGRALAGVGRSREAAESMRACIEAVKTAPAYKYRAEKRWLNEAQQFLRSHA